MFIPVSLVILTLWIVWKFVFSTKYRGDLDEIPGSKISLFRKILAFTKASDRARRHVIFSELAKKYGPIIRIPLPTGLDIIMVSDYEGIHEVLIGSAKDFGGRPVLFRMEEMTKKTGILFSYRTDATWKALRKVSHRHLRQFGDGLSRLENIITEVAEDMFLCFREQGGKAFDPHKMIFDAALNSIAFLLTGERTESGDPIIEKMREYEDLFNRCGSSTAPWKLRILDTFPWLRHLGLTDWGMIQRHQELEQDIWRTITDRNDANPDANSLCRVLRAHIDSESGVSPFTSIDARKTSLQLLFAGVTTTTNTFYGGINLLAHHPEVQKSLFDEIKRVTAGSRDIVLTDRPKMHYGRAIILEFLRYVSVVPLGVPHLTMVNTTLKGYKLPPGTMVLANQYALHHDDDLWGDPYNFRPERFLDTNGELVPADHPHRKNLLPFGAGLRVCLGESLALSRLFLWTTSLVQKFIVEPADGNTKDTTDSRGYTSEGVLKPVKYEIILTKR